MSNNKTSKTRTVRKTVRRSERIQNLRRKLRAVKARHRGRSVGTCLPSLKRRRRRRSKSNKANLLQTQNPMDLSPIRAAKKSPSLREEEQKWLASSEGIKNAKILVCEGKISLEELKQIVAADKKYHAITTNRLNGLELDNKCPISLESFKSGPYETVVLVDPESKCQITYDTESLGEYIIKSGNRICPVQRRAYSDKELEMIDEFLKQIGFGGGSVISAVNDTKRKEANKFQTEAMTGLDNLIADCLNEIFALLEEKNTDRQTIFTRFLMNIVPNFEDLYFQMVASDAEYAQICLEQYISRLSGPPNRPTKDPYDILPRILDFFRSKIDIQRRKRIRARSADSIMDVPGTSISERIV